MERSIQSQLEQALHNQEEQAHLRERNALRAQNAALLATPNPGEAVEVLTIIQAAAFRRESGSPLSQNAIRDAVAAGRLKRYALPSHGDKLLVSRAEVEAYQPVGHKPGGYKHEKPLTEKDQS